MTAKHRNPRKPAPLSEKKYRLDDQYLADQGISKEEYIRRMKMQPALGKKREKAKDRFRTGTQKGQERRKEGSDEEINANSTDWDETDSDEAL